MHSNKQWKTYSWKHFSTGFEMNVAVAILRLQEGLDCSEILADIDDLILNKTPKDKTESCPANEWSITNRNPSISTNVSISN